jgi:hypothetical protein
MYVEGILFNCYQLYDTYLNVACAISPLLYVEYMG